MALDVEALLQPISEEEPSGPDLSYDRDFRRISRELDEEGHSLIEQVLSPDQCQSVADLYSHDDLFRSRIIMARHGFGRRFRISC